MKHIKVTLCAFIAVLLCGCGLLSGSRIAAGVTSAPAETPEAGAPAPAYTPPPSPTPSPLPTPELPPRYYEGEELGGVVLEVQRISDETSAFLLQTFWMEAMFVNVDNSAITDEAGGTYILAPGARVIVRFGADVPDEPPFNVTASGVKIVDYLTDINGADPYFVVLRNLFSHETELYKGIGRVAIDLSGAADPDEVFMGLAREFCENRGYELLIASERELKETGMMNENGFIDGGVYLAFSDSGEKKGVLAITAQRRVGLQTGELRYTLKKQADNKEAIWYITQVK